MKVLEISQMADVNGGNAGQVNMINEGASKKNNEKKGNPGQRRRAAREQNKPLNVSKEVMKATCNGLKGDNAKAFVNHEVKVGKVTVKASAVVDCSKM